MQKAFAIAGGFLIIAAGFGIRQFFAGPTEVQEQDRALALREKRRREVELAAALRSERDGLGHRLMVLYRTGEWKRKSAA